MKRAINASARRLEAELLAFALGYPGAYEDSPWGERVAKVGKKVFVFFGVPRTGLNVTVKLPESASLALGLPFVSPTGYGLGRSGWVTASFGRRDAAPVPVLKQWIDESYRAVAPKKLVKQLDESEPAAVSPRSNPRPDRAARHRRRPPARA